MNEEIRQMVENYHMGFISSHDFLCQYTDFLRQFGAHKCIEDKISEQLNNLADDIINMLSCGNKYNNMIEHHGSGVFLLDKGEEDVGI